MIVGTGIVFHKFKFPRNSKNFTLKIIYQCIFALTHGKAPRANIGFVAQKINFTYWNALSKF